MTSLTPNLPNDVAALKALLLQSYQQIGQQKSDLDRQQLEIDKKQKIIETKTARIEHLTELLLYANHKIYRPSSERWEGQPLLFNEAEEQATDKPNASEKQKISYSRNKPKRKPIPQEFKRVDIDYDLSEEDKICKCGAELKPIGEVSSEQLDIIPAVVQVLRHRRKKYACPCCKETVRTAKMPKQMIPGGLPSSNLLAHIATSKFADGLPLYRQESILKRAQIDLTRGTMANWMIKLGRHLRPLINLMRDDLLESQVLHIDETTIKVLKEKGRKATDKSFVWVQASGNGDPPIVLFDYDPSRSAAVAQTLLAGYKGYLVTDGYEGYGVPVRKNPGIVHCACWDHARRKFHDVIKSRNKEAKPGLADEALWYIGKIFDIDRREKSQLPQRKLLARQLYTDSVLIHLRRWLDRVIDTVPPKSKLGKALHYLDNQWNKLSRILENGSIPLSNARAENAIRPFVVGRKAWLFADTPSGAEASCAIYSLIESAKANGLDPFRYLSYIISRLPNMDTIEEYETLLPYRVQNTDV